MEKPYTLAEAVARLEAVPVSAQRTLHSVILEVLYRKKPTACFSDAADVADLDALEKAGLVALVDDPEAAMRHLGRNELVKRLSAAGVAGFKRSGSMDALVAWCMDAGAAVLPAISGVVSAVPAAEMERVRKKVYIYLSRKYEDESYYDPDVDEMLEIPKGAALSVTISHGKRGELRAYFPDDEITALLDKYGCNRCASWGRP